MPTSSTVWWPSMCRSPLALDVEVDQAVARDLVEHVVEEADAGRELRGAAAVEVDADADLRFLGVAADVGGARRSADRLRGGGGGHAQAGARGRRASAYFPPACRPSGAGSRRAAGAAPETFLTSTPRAFMPSNDARPRRARAPGSCWPRSGTACTPGSAAQLALQALALGAQHAPPGARTRRRARARTASPRRSAR